MTILQDVALINLIIGSKMNYMRNECLVMSQHKPLYIIVNDILYYVQRIAGGIPFPCCGVGYLNIYWVLHGLQ